MEAHILTGYYIIANTNATSSSEIAIGTKRRVIANRKAFTNMR